MRYTLNQDALGTRRSTMPRSFSFTYLTILYGIDPLLTVQEYVEACLEA